MRLSQEEIFAPILGIASFETEEEVVRRANETSMGLASYVFTKNVDRLWRMFENLEAGMIGLVRVLISRCFCIAACNSDAPLPARDMADVQLSCRTLAIARQLRRTSAA